MSGSRLSVPHALDDESGQAHEDTPLLSTGEAGDLEGEAAPRKRSTRGTLTRRHTLILGEIQGHRWRMEDSIGTMSGTAFVINMFADICPPGFLPPPSGLKGTGYVPAILLVFLICGVCIYTMWVVGKTTLITGKTTFRGQWEVTLGKQTAWIPVLVIVLVAFGGCLSYSCLCADLFKGVLPAFGVHPTRTQCLVIFSLFPLMPLCMLKDLSALAYSSFVAVLMTGYTVFVMVLRAVDGSYDSGGEFFKSLPKALILEKQHEEAHLWQVGLGSVKLLNFLAMGFLAHYNGCKYYRELCQHTPTRMKNVSGIAMGFTAVLYIVIMIAGFRTFGQSSEGVILENYSEEDTLANIAQLGIACSILVSFPLMFSGLREALLELMCIACPSCQERSESVMFQNGLSVIFLVLITVGAFFFTDAGLVIGLVGAICGSAIIYIVPCILYASALEKFGNKDKHHWEIILVKSVACIGVVFAVLGLVSALAS